MIFPVPFWVISVTISIFKLIYSLFIGAILVFYVKFSRDEYANSIRWSCTGGIFEMIPLFWASCRSVPRMTRVVFALALVGSLSVLSVSSILTALVSRVDKEERPTTARALTSQVISMDPSFWSTPLSPESTVEEALTAMFNDTRRNPNPRPRMRYSPRTFTYNTSCNESTAAITVDGKTSVFFPPTNIKCKMYGFAIVPIGYYWDPTAAIQKQIDSSTFMIVAPANKLNSSEVDYAIEPFLFAFRAKHQCAAKVSDINIGVILPESPKDGVVILPKTLSTRCHYGPEDDSLILSTTYLQFALSNVQNFENVTASILDDPKSLPLLSHMKVAIQEGAFVDATNNSRLVTLTKSPSAASGIDVLVCQSLYHQGHKAASLICTYMLTSIIAVSPQTVDPTIAADLNYRGPEPPSYYNASNHIDVIIRHLPRNLEQDDSQEPSPPFSSAQLIKATAGAAKYLASLGHNVYIYKDSESNADQLYILYDAIEIKDAYEIPNAVLATVIALTVLFGLVWYISERFQVVYNSTLYKTIYKELNTRDETVPMLLRYTGNPLAFDGNQVISKSDDLQNIAPETQDHPMVSMERQDNQSLASLDQTSIHYPITNSVSSTTSTPIMSLATPTPNSTTASTTWPSHGTQLQPPRNSSPGLLPHISRGDLDLQMELYPHPRSLNDTHDGDQASFPSTHQ